MKRILVVTHGDKFPGANPGMTEKGFEQIKALRCLLPDNPTNVVCGTGHRYGDVAKALELTPNRYSSVFGDGDSMKKVGDQNMVILTDGMKLPMQACTTLKDLTPITQAVVSQLPDETVICAGRPLMIMLDYPQGKSGAVYQADIADSGRIIRITEVVALGVPDPCLTK